MNQTKPAWASMTVISAALLLLSVGLQVAGVEFSAEDQAAASEHIYAAIDGFLALSAMVGRIRATKRIGQPNVPQADNTNAAGADRP